MNSKRMKRALVFWPRLTALIVALVVSSCSSPINKSSAKKFRERQQQFSVCVYPVNIVRGERIENDPELAIELLKFIETRQIARCETFPRSHSYDFKWGSDASAMMRRSAKAFAAQVKTDSIGTDYALLAEILTNKNENTVFGVRYYLVDNNGDIAEMRMQHDASAWKEFREVAPTERRSALKVIEMMISKAWQGETINKADAF